MLTHTPPDAHATLFARRDAVQVVKVDTEKYPALASKHQVSALPTLVLFKAGKPVDRIEGLPQKQQLLDRLRYFLRT